MVAISTVKPGDVLYDVGRVKLGHVNSSRMAVARVNVISVDHADGSAIVRWNGNAPKTYYARDLRRLVRTPPKGTYEREQLDKERAAEKSGGEK